MSTELIAAGASPGAALLSSPEQIALPRCWAAVTAGFLFVVGIERSRGGDHDLPAGMPRLHVAQRLRRLRERGRAIDHPDHLPALQQLPPRRGGPRGRL